MTIARRTCLLISPLILVLGISAPATAQTVPMDRSFDVQIFEPAIGPRQLLQVETARVAGHLGWGVGLQLGMQNSPLSVYLVDEQTQLKERYPIIGNQVYGHVWGYFGFLKRFQVALGIPIYWQSQDGRFDDLQAEVGRTVPAVGGAAMGDLRLHFKGHIWSFKQQMFNLGASLLVTLPVFHLAGVTDRFMGDVGATIWPRFIFDFRWRDLTAAANVGFLARTADSTFLSTQISHSFTYAVGAMYKAAKFRGWYLDVIAELNGRNGLTDELDQNPLEVDLGIRFGSGFGLSVWLGGGAGLIKAVGSPKFRLFAGVQFAPDFADADGDGIPDYRDKCPDQPEDKDGFEDSDGCPDPDNDKDGIPDVKDKCPNEPEDFDNFEDEDGCPELDNDKDGVPDKQDNCPLKPGPKESRGCPPDMLDDDGDGIPNHKDKCPTEPEDKDGFEDEDGCPDPDNDKDGIPDEHDKCPNDPEDKDGFEDADGCPDPDDDGDGVCDDNPVIQKNLAKFKGVCIGADKCPKEQETINGITDDDGCADQGEASVKLDLQGTADYKGRFLLTKKLQFTDPHGAELSEEDKSILKQLAHILRLPAAKVIKQVAIMVHTDTEKTADEAKAITTAQAKAIKKYLTDAGIDANRLAEVPAANASPVCKPRRGSKSAARRCAIENRRVELYILQLGN
jgi:outer membrane protein OmpA-like peptidoglycan-associated protein